MVLKSSITPFKTVQHFQWGKSASTHLISLHHSFKSVCWLVFQGFRARASPTFALFSIALVSTSPDMVKRDFGRHSCCRRALAIPELFTRAFTVVNGSSECCVPMVREFSLLEKPWLNSAPTAVLVNGLTVW